MEGFITMERTSERSVLMFQLAKAKPHMLKLSSPENSHHLTLKEKYRTSFETDVPYSLISSHLFPICSISISVLSTAELPSQRKGLASRSEFHEPAVPQGICRRSTGIFFAEKQRFSIEEKPWKSFFIKTWEKKHQPFNHYGIYPLVISLWKCPGKCHGNQQIIPCWGKKLTGLSCYLAKRILIASK